MIRLASELGTDNINNNIVTSMMPKFSKTRAQRHIKMKGLDNLEMLK